MTFTAMNRNPMEGVRCVTADITDFDAIRPHFEGQDTVVHLAAALSTNAEDETRDYIERNVWGTYTVYEAARQAGVKRVIFASSGSTILSHTLESPLKELESGEYDKLPATWPMLTHESAIRPNSIYGVSKVWGEALARYYSDAFGLSSTCIRFGWIPEEDRPEATRTFAVWCSHDDAAQMIDKCIEADEQPPVRHLLRGVGQQVQLPGHQPRAGSNRVRADEPGGGLSIEGEMNSSVRGVPIRDGCGLKGDLVYSRKYALLEGAMKWSSAVSDSSSMEEALDQCAESIREELGSESVDLAVVFASPHHGESYERIPGNGGEAAWERSI